MKKLILIFAILASSLAGNSQKVQIDSKGNYVAVKASNDTTKAKDSGKTYTDNAGKTYPVFVSAKGKLFVIRTSKNNIQYKQYLKL